MAYNVHLADRVRELLVDGPPASGQGGLLVRVDPARAARLLATTNARPMEMEGRAVQGWLHVDGNDLRTKRQLSQWIAIGTPTTRSAPAKRPNR